MFSLPQKTIVAAALVLAAFAGQAQTTRIRGTIESAQPNSLTVKLTDGEHAKVVLAPGAAIVGVVKASMSDIKEGTFIGSAAMPQPDGTQRALEVHIFPEEMRGTGEGHRPYAPVPQSTMTNGATAGSAVKGVDGSTITIKYKEGEKKIVVPPNTPVVRYVIGSASDLKPGAHFTVLAATKKPDGSYEASRINVGRDGVVPQ
jgi:outer membrane lipoprotein SlyB